jgi:putative flippase GtrA
MSAAEHLLMSQVPDSRDAFRLRSSGPGILDRVGWIVVEPEGIDRGVAVRQLIRFGVVGCANTVLSWCAYALLAWLGVHYLLASAIAWILGALNSYLLNRRWTFRSRARHAPEVVRFALVQGGGLALDVMLLDALTRDAGVQHLLAQALVYPATMIATFLLSRHWAFAGLDRVREWPA